MNNDLISRDYVEKIIISEFVNLQDGTEEWRTYVNDTCENILNKVHSAPTVDFIISPDYVTELQNINKELIKQLEEAVRPQGEWIPVSERLPEESLNSVIGWDAYRERCVFVQYIDGHFQITGNDESFDIVAWQPVPEPYKKTVRNER